MSNQIYCNGHYHNDVIVNGMHHKAIYKGSTLFWTKQVNDSTPTFLSAHLQKGTFVNRGLTMTVQEDGTIVIDGTFVKGSNIYWRINGENICGVGSYTSIASTDTMIEAGQIVDFKLNHVSGTVSAPSATTSQFNFLFRTLKSNSAYNNLNMHVLSEGQNEKKATASEALSVLCFYIASSLTITFDKWTIKPDITFEEPDNTFYFPANADYWCYKNLPDYASLTAFPSTINGKSVSPKSWQNVNRMMFFFAGMKNLKLFPEMDLSKTEFVYSFYISFTYDANNNIITLGACTATDMPEYDCGTMTAILSLYNTSSLVNVGGFQGMSISVNASNCSQLTSLSIYNILSKVTPSPSSTETNLKTLSFAGLTIQPTDVYHDRIASLVETLTANGWLITGLTIE